MAGTRVASPGPVTLPGPGQGVAAVGQGQQVQPLELPTQAQPGAMVFPLRNSPGSVPQASSAVAVAVAVSQRAVQVVRGAVDMAVERLPIPGSLPGPRTLAAAAAVEVTPGPLAQSDRQGVREWSLFVRLFPKMSYKRHTENPLT